MYVGLFAQFDVPVDLTLVNLASSLELGALVSIHKEKKHENEEPLTEDEVLIIQGALSMRNKVVKDAFVPLESVYMLDAHSKMDIDCMREVSCPSAVPSGLGSVVTSIAIKKAHSITVLLSQAREMSYEI